MHEGARRCRSGDVPRRSLEPAHRARDWLDHKGERRGLNPRPSDHNRMPGLCVASDPLFCGSARSVRDSLELRTQHPLLICYCELCGSRLRDPSSAAARAVRGSWNRASVLSHLPDGSSAAGTPLASVLRLARCGRSSASSADRVLRRRSAPPGRGNAGRRLTRVDVALPARGVGRARTAADGKDRRSVLRRAS